MTNHHWRLINSKNAVASAFLLILFFSGTANAVLSGIDPGYPRFIANKTYVDYYNAGGNTFYFDAYNVNNKVYWQESASSSKERIKGGPDFYAQVDIDASNPSAPTVLAGSYFEMWGKVPTFGGQNDLLFTADIKKVFWTTGPGAIIEFVMDGASMSGLACDLDFCTYTDEVLQFKLKGSFNGDWGNEFYKTARGIATIPLPAAVWLFSSAILGLGGLRLRRQQA